MINFMYNNKRIIGTLSILAMFSVWSNVANASENRLDDSKNIVLEETIKATEVAKSVSRAKEDQLEKYFIKLLQNQAYDYLSINSEEELINNLQLQLENINNYKFSENEWNNFFKIKPCDIEY